jgi:hypothetical protein
VLSGNSKMCDPETGSFGAVNSVLCCWNAASNLVGVRLSIEGNPGTQYDGFTMQSLP